VRPEQVDVVLVRPARPRNVAAAARAMKNMGLGTLRLVDPPPGTADADARALAYGAWEILDAAETAPSLQQAVASCAFVVGASARGAGTFPPDFGVGMPAYLAPVVGRFGERALLILANTSTSYITGDGLGAFGLSADCIA